MQPADPSAPPSDAAGRGGRSLDPQSAGQGRAAVWMDRPWWRRRPPPCLNYSPASCPIGLACRNKNGTVADLIFTAEGNPSNYAPVLAGFPPREVYNRGSRSARMRGGRCLLHTFSEATLGVRSPDGRAGRSAVWQNVLNSVFCPNNGRQSGPRPPPGRYPRPRVPRPRCGLQILPKPCAPALYSGVNAPLGSTSARTVYVETRPPPPAPPYSATGTIGRSGVSQIYCYGLFARRDARGIPHGA